MSTLLKPALTVRGDGGNHLSIGRVFRRRIRSLLVITLVATIPQLYVDPISAADSADVAKSTTAERLAALEADAAFGAFDVSLLSSQARYVLQFIEPDDSYSVFFALLDNAVERDLSHWQAVKDVPSAVKVLVRCFLLGRGTAYIAAGALWKAPVGEIARPLLEDALLQLTSRAQEYRIAALTLATLVEESVVKSWAYSNEPFLREVVASIYAGENGQAPDALHRLLAFDADGWVRESAIAQIVKLRGPEVAELLESMGASPDPGWKCRHCGEQNDASAVMCGCRVAGPKPAKAALEALRDGAPSEEPRRTVMHF